MVSNRKEFMGLRGLDQLQGFHMIKHKISDVKPNPATWIKTAAVSWLKQNDAVDMPNLADTSTHYGNANAKEFQEAEKQGQMIEAIRNEHNRIYMQD